MTTHTNGHSPAILPLPALQAVALIPHRLLLADAELDALDTATTELRHALTDQAAARALLADACARVDAARALCRIHRAAIAVNLAGGSQ